MAPQLPSWTEAGLSLRLESYPTILLGNRHPAGHNIGQESEGELLGRYAPAVRGGAQRLEHRMIIASKSGMLFRKPGFDSLRASINPVIVPQVLSSPPPAWYLLDALVFFQPPTEPQSTYCVLLDGEPILGHARIGDAIYGVYNGNPHFLRNMPTYEDAPPPYHASMHGNFTSPTYASPATPYIMFIPSVHPWYGPLLNRLNYKRSGLPIIEFEHGRWGLASSLADDWWTLETNLRRVLNAMMDIAKKRTKGMVPFGWPSRWGYLNKFRTEQSARTAIVRAIRGFLPLIGSLSMYF
ncbi:hypothetical protein B0H13DRAFT_1894799, partial [Mycena leptocephala]